MNKLLTVALILAMVSVASAGLTWKVDGSTDLTVSASDDIDIELWVDFDASGLSLPFIGDGTAGGTATSGFIHGSFDLSSDVGFDYDAYPSYVHRGQIGWVLGAVNPPGYPTGLIWSMNYIVPSFSGSIPFFIEDNPGDGLIAAAWEKDNLDTIAIPGLTLVPEPITIALLGLGGLFLRRRK